MTMGNDKTVTPSNTPTRKCKGCSNNIATEQVECPKCPAYYYPSVPKTQQSCQDGDYKGASEIETLTQNISSLRVSVDSHTKAIIKGLDAVEERTDQLSTKLEALELVSTNNSKNIAAVSESLKNIVPNADDSVILMEIEDESNQELLADRQKHDSKVINEICNTVAPGIIINGCTRIGQFSSSLALPRPMKVFLSRSHQVDLSINGLLRLKRQTSVTQSIQKLSITKDRTNRQRQEFNDLQAEVIRRKAQGERNL
ncbi:hypothetical protein KQX54_015609 [Cotesia glomerata]|uniref:Uncharacterized protein n=1 Tax=Cotesia glomerata TaxID=32391 RepID=A0AAV7J745_COTGL|nr:hypothetical protein KQX54_015609 [Cotesia glomerata]